MTIAQALEIGVQRLKRKGLRTPRLDAELILATILGQGRAYLLAHPEAELKPSEVLRFEDWLTKREDHYPLQYLRGFQEFYGREFRVAPGVLIPRPETEAVVETVLTYLRKLPSHRVQGADIGTGSGCIAITLVCEERRLRMLATDVSTKALRIARENARRLGCPAAGLSFVRVDLLPDYARDLDLIVSNPPYVDRNGSESVDLSVLRHEPAGALYADDRGLAVYKKIFSEARDSLKTSGRLFLELGSGMLAEVACSARASGWQLEASFPDLAGIQRCAVFSKG